MLSDPRRYGVLDIRVWQMLYRVKSVKKKPTGVGFNFNDWFHYLTKLRYHAKELGTTARMIEWTLFLAHKNAQTGRLYQVRQNRRN